MKRILFFVLALFVVLPCFARQNLDETLVQVSKDIAARCEKREVIAILDFAADAEEMSAYISSQLTAMIFEHSTLQVVTRQHMDKVEKELDFHISGAVSDSTALSICERLGAHAIVFGALDELDNKYLLQVKMLSVATGSYALFKKYEVARSSRTEQLLHHAARIYKSSLGFIVEANKNSVSGISPAGGISFDYSLTRKFSLGVKAIVSYDSFEKDNTIYAIEPLGFLRWYVVSPTGEPSAGVFVECQGGAELLLVNSDFKTAVSAGLALGFRIPLGNFYVEPILRGGYPYMFGAGLGAGFRF